MERTAFHRVPELGNGVSEPAGTQWHAVQPIVDGTLHTEAVDETVDGDAVAAARLVFGDDLMDAEVAS